MKKFFMVAALAVAALTANAQVWIGGNLGVHTDKTKIEDTEIGTNTTVEIAPEIGYNLNEKWAVALQLGYQYSSNAANVLGSTDLKGSVNTFSIKPYARYTFVKAGNFSAFCDGYLSYETAHVRNIDNNYNAMSVGLTPGIAYAISPKVTLVAHIGDLSYAHGWHDRDVQFGEISSTVTEKNNAFDFNIKNSISFGAYVNL